MSATEQMGTRERISATQRSALYEHRGTRAIQRMVEFAPSTGGLALWVRHQDLPPTTHAPLIATDGHTLFYGAGFAALPTPEQAGLIAHEVLHVALRHPARMLALQAQLGDVDLQLFTICADAIVNSALAHLRWLQLPAGSITLDRLLAETLNLQEAVEKSLLEWDVERLYRAIDDRRARAAMPSQQQAGREPKARSGGGASGTSPQGAGSRTQQPESAHGGGRQDGPRAARARALGARAAVDLMPDASVSEAPEAAAERAREWSERLLRAHAGDGAHSMLRTLLADLPRTRTPWEQILRTQLARGLARSPDLSWSRPTRSYLANQGRSGSRAGGRAGARHRMPWEPGITPSRSVPRLVVIVDVSGSIEDTLLERFAREIEAIVRRLEAGLMLVIGDDAVQRVVHCEPGRAGLSEIEFNGRGGTDFTPLLQEADRHAPDIGVVLTDLQGPAQFRPRWPVLWAVPEAFAQAIQPFGRKLILN
jgi:predicted metal-dependent peptidase